MPSVSRKKGSSNCLRRIILQGITAGMILLLQFSVLMIGKNTAPIPLGSDTITNDLLATGSRKASNLTHGWEFLPEGSRYYTYGSLPDSGWTAVDLKTFDGTGWSGDGWFRTTLQISDTVTDSTISFLYAHYGAVEFYYAGELLHADGAILPDGTATGERVSRFPSPVLLDVRRQNRDFAVHVHSSHKREHMDSYWFSSWWRSQQPGFMLSFIRTDLGRPYYIKEIIVNNLLLIAATALLILSLLYFFIYLNAIILKESLLYSLYGILLTASALIFNVFNQYTPLEWSLFNYYGTWGLFSISAYFGLLLLGSLYKVNLKNVVLIGVIINIVSLEIDRHIGFNVIPIPMAIFSVVNLSLIIYGLIKKKSGAWIVAVGYSSLAIIAALWVTLYGELRDFSMHIEALWLIGFLPPFIAFTYIISNRIGEIWQQRQEFHEQIMELLEKSTLLEQQAATNEHINAEVREFNRALVKQLDMRTQELIIAERQASFGQFVQGIVHNLKNPLSGIIGYADMSRESVRELRERLEISGGLTEDVEAGFEDLEDDVNTVIDGGNQLLEMLNSLMSKSRGDQDSQAVVCDLNDCLRNELEFLNADPRLKKVIKLDIRLAAEPLFVKAVRGEMTQVISNLVINARDALHEIREPEIVITSWQDGDWVGFDVRDNGCGIQPKNLKRIFDPFYTTKRLLNDENKNGGGNTPSGTGLGMWICKQMVSSHGGRIEVDSEVGVGTTVTIRLPGVIGDTVEPRGNRREPAQHRHA